MEWSLEDYIKDAKLHESELGKRVLRRKKVLDYRLNAVRYTSLVLTIILLGGVIGTFYIEQWYTGADGPSYLLGFTALCGGLLCGAWIYPPFGQLGNVIIVRLISYVVAILFNAGYLASQGI